MTVRMKVAGETCHYCAAPADTRDHIVPRALGGKDGLYNIVPCCSPCNGTKADAWPSCPCAHCETARRTHEDHIYGPPALLASLGEFSPTLGGALGDAASVLARWVA